MKKPNGKVELVPVLYTSAYLQLGDVSAEVLKEEIESHLVPLRQAEEDDSMTCPLSGGIELRINGELMIGPQCCGDLSDIRSWCQVAMTGFTSGYIAPEGHPMPYVERENGWLRFTCVDAWESFRLGTVSRFALAYSAYEEAIPALLESVETFTRLVDVVTAQMNLAIRSSDLVDVPTNAIRIDLGL